MSETSATPIPVRAFMLDVSRDRVPTRESLEVMVDLLQACHYNQLELYMEHTFAYQGEDEVWAEASPITADDMRWLDKLCAGKGIDLVANRNSLGHMERWLKHPSHAHRAENPEGFEAWGQHWPASTVAVTDENLAFVKRLLDELVATTTTRAVNIGMDEPWEFGQGASKELVEREGTGKVYTDWVLAVAEPWLDKGYRVEMWGDILEHHPEQAERLPEGLALVLWGYESPEQIRRIRGRAGLEVGQRPGFGDQSAAFVGRRQQASDLWVAPGTGVWNSVTGRLEHAVGNLVDAAEVASEIGAGGYINTSWGDNGHWEGYTHCLVPIVVGGFAALDPARANELADRQTLTELVSDIIFGGPGHPGAELLVGVGHLASLLDAPTSNSTPLFLALQGRRDEVPEIDAKRFAAIRAEIARLDELADSLPRAGWIDELRTSIALAEVAVDRLEGKQRTIDADVVGQVRRNWLASSRPGGLDDSLGKLSEVQLDGEAQQAAEGSFWAGLLGR